MTDTRQEQGAPAASAATLACLNDEIVSRIAVFFRQLHASDESYNNERAIQEPYKALSTLALVGLSFCRAAQRELNRFLLFRSGAQVQKWLDYAEQHESMYPTYQLVLVDELPFCEGDDPASKWPLSGLKALFNKVVGVKYLAIYFACQPSIPVELLCSKNLRSVILLELASPLKGKLGSPIACMLVRLAIVDRYPQYKRDWSATFRLLASSPAASTLRMLDFQGFPQASSHMLALVPFAPSCRHLSLPFLKPNDLQKWRLWVFARLCDDLQCLCIRGYKGDAIDVLLAFPTGPPVLYLDELTGTVGYGHPLVDEKVIPVKDSVNTLVAVVFQKANWGQPIRQLVVDHRRNVTPRHQGNLISLALGAGVQNLQLGSKEDSLSKKERETLTRYIAESNRTSQYEWTQSLVELEEIA
ncbi:hypothetical protein JCM10908_002160 [Rhodotorula pacifica]|uniref:uncharacterized protein n=1 Tax=Rhodotorula pacifica TaxID=1495444 RepID=UPI003181B8D9